MGGFSQKVIFISPFLLTAKVLCNTIESYQPRGVFMKKFRMSAEIARVLFDAKDGVLFWADNGAVNEAVRGRRVGATSSNFEQTSYLGNRYDTADLLHLVERGEWPAYEDTKKGLQAKVQKKNTAKRDSRTYSREMQDVIAERLSVIEDMLRGEE